MSGFTPELGQMLYGQPYKSYDVPEIWEAALCILSDRLCSVMWNINQKEYQSPFQNTGEQFECDSFSAHAYSWGDDEQPWNFKWKDVEISWYKYLGRGMSANKPLSTKMASDMLIECLRCLDKMDVD